jgi:hypothetical protein
MFKFSGRARIRGYVLDCSVVLAAVLDIEVTEVMEVIDVMEVIEVIEVTEDGVVVLEGVGVVIVALVGVDEAMVGVDEGVDVPWNWNRSLKLYEEGSELSMILKA